MKVAIAETMEQVHKHCEKYLALHREQTDVHRAMVRAIHERWPGASPADVLEQAEVNSLTQSRNRAISEQAKNSWVDTTVQGDLFHNIQLRIPSYLMVDGKPTPYYEASIVDGFAWWSARRDAKKSEADAFTKAATSSADERDEAAAEAGRLQDVMQTARNNGIDPSSVKYARKA